jgi:hypothetical protein
MRNLHLAILSFLFYNGVMAQTMVIFYDGNANQYTLQKQQLVYKAVQPIHSSSGNYSGGKDTTVSLSFEQLKQIEIKLQALQKNKKDLIKTRLLGSYALVKGKTQMLYQMHTVEAKALTAYLRSICAP